MTADFRRSELPATSGLHREIGEILTGAGRIERSFGDVSRGIDLNPDADANDTLNGSEGFLGNVGQNLLEDFTAYRR